MFLLSFEGLDACTQTHTHTHTHTHTQNERQREDLLEFLENFLKQSTFQTDNNLAEKLVLIVA